MIKLGDEVKDEITGFQGIAVARIESLYEATSVRVHPRACNEHDGLPRTPFWIEKDRLTVVRQIAVVGFVNVAGKAAMEQS